MHTTEIKDMSIIVFPVKIDVIPVATNFCLNHLSHELTKSTKCVFRDITARNSDVPNPFKMSERTKLRQLRVTE